MPPAINLTELEQDALKEMFNIGVGHAADSLSQMVNEEVRLSVPSLQILSRQEAEDQFRSAPISNFCGVVQRFEGEFNAHAILMFPGVNSLELVRLMVGEMVPLEEMNDLEQDALTEVGNVLLNSCVSAMSDTVGGHFRSSMPEYISGLWRDMLPNNPEPHEHVLLLNIQFELERRHIQGYLLFLMQLDSIEHFKQAVMHYMNKYL